MRWPHLGHSIYVICAIDLFAKVEYAKEHKKGRALDLLADFWDFFFDYFDVSFEFEVDTESERSNDIWHYHSYLEISWQAIFENNEENS